MERAVDPSLLPALVLLVVVVCFVASLRDPPSFFLKLRDHLEQLARELDGRVDRNRLALRPKVYSAETIDGKEAEFIRERLPRKAPLARFVLLLFLIGVFAWLFARQLG
jgi:hypothetical protein